MMRRKPFEASQNGFTLVELLVGMLVGAIVLTMAISILVSTNQASAQLMSRQEVSQNTRIAMTQILKDLGSAQSMLQCVVWSNAATQSQYQEYLQNVNDPAYFGVLAFSGSPDECLEFFETGRVLVFASKDAVCWHKNQTDGSGVINFSIDPRIACLVRPLQADSPGVNPPDCGGAFAPGLSHESLYYYECSNTTFNYFSQPNQSLFSTGFTGVPGSLREVVQFVPSGEIPDIALPEVIFAYDRSDGSSIPTDGSSDTNNIETVRVTLDIIYRAARGSGQDTSEFNTYRFSNRVLLQGVRAFVEQGAYGGNFVG